MFRYHWQLIGVVGLAAMLAAESASAQSAPVSADQIDKLEAQIQILQREVQALKAKTVAADKAHAAAPPATKAPAPPPTAIAKMSPGNRPSICTADNLNCIAITSRLHLDVGGYWYHPAKP
jgi:phosphate-selective porin OprO/OprP